MITNEKTINETNVITEVHSDFVPIKPKDSVEQVSENIRLTLENTDIKTNESVAYKFIKRALDIIISLCALIVLSPLMLVVALIIYFDDKGSPIFSQVRYTKNGKTFKMYKFRSMYMDADKRFKEVEHLNESQNGVIFKAKNDPRITKIGKFIRKTSIDELPQLVNILMGDMSIVGPRPSITREVIQYTPYQMNRFLVKGGLTCFWQCSGRSNLGFEQQVELDIKYIKSCSVLTDAKIILKTFKAVFNMEGAE